jgi:hypothetical protein
MGGVIVIYIEDRLNHRLYRQHPYKLALSLQIHTDYQSNQILIAR